MLCRRYARVSAALLVVPLLLADAPARAQAPAPPSLASATDIVHLSNGGMVRGTIVEVLPGDSLAIVAAADGRTVRVPWGEVREYTRDGESADVVAGIPVIDTPKPPEPDGPRLHIALTREAPVELLEVTRETFHADRRGSLLGVHYTEVCVAPCDLVIGGDEPRTYFFGGAGVTPSQQFTLSGKGGELRVHVKPGRRGLRHGGIAALGLGLVGVGVGIGLFGLANERRIVAIPDEGIKAVAPDFTMATGVLITGGALLVGGVVMFLLGRTRVAWLARRRGR